jgi:signal recognition particle receptor subunit beta
MSTVNVMAREVSAKVVFYGPGLSGKTTSLKRIYESIKPSLRGELMSLPTEADRTLFFDFLPVRVERVGDYALRLALYTVPGQVFYNATRKLVLQGADGIIFVADSNPGADDANRESMANLEENLAEQGIRLEHFPLVIQYNKRDLAQGMPLEQMRSALNPREVPEYATCATNGEGVLDAMKAMIRLVIKDLRARKVVPTPKAPAVIEKDKKTPSGITRDSDTSLEDHIQQHLSQVSDAPRVPPTLGPIASLAPHVLVDQAAVAEAAFEKGDFDGCVRACVEALARALAFAGDGATANQAYLLGMNGRDVLELQTRALRGAARIDDAALALYVLSQALVRLSQAGLPPAT